MSLDDLPVILVSASDDSIASSIISELIDNELEENTYKDSGWRVWLLENKYYTAAVRLQPRSDSAAAAPDTTPPAAPAQGHVIYLTENEDVTVAEKRRNSAAGRLSRGAVRLVLVDLAESSEKLLLWGLRVRYEVVPLREVDCGEEAGIERARAALHAHVWPGLHRRGSALLPPDLLDEEESSDGEGKERNDKEESAIEQTERFAKTLGMLAALTERRAELSDEQRRERAEQLVAACCRALGHDLRG